MDSKSEDSCTLSFVFIRRPFHEVLETLLQEWHRDPINKVLIFTKSVKLLNMLDYHLKSHCKESHQLHITQLSGKSHRPWVC